MVFAFGTLVLAVLFLDAGITGRSLAEVVRGELSRGRGLASFAGISIPDIQLAASPNAQASPTTTSYDTPPGAGSAQGTASFDGKTVAAVAIPYLEFARAHGWRGTVTSGYRTPEYSESLCRNMCGAPSCPGRCAGRSSNHSGTSRTHFAIDVSDESTFGQLMARPDAPQPKIFNNLPADRIHFSPTGG